MNEAIKINSLTKDYGNGKGIFDFNYSISKGEVFGLVGTNGSGKTTTMRHLMGFLKADKGSCEILGYDCWKKSDKIMKHIGYVPGEIDFPDVGTGENFLKIQAQLLGISDMSYTNELIDRFKLAADAPLRRMSKGMKQKTALVSAFMSKPDILLLDEPSTGLDPLMRDTLIQLILEHNQRGATVLMSSHIFKELEETCNRVAFIHNGKMMDSVDRSMYDSSVPKQYRIGFADQKEYKQFLDIKPFEIVKHNDKYGHLYISVGENDVSRVFSQLKNYNIRYMKYNPYSLETYYTEVIENGGKNNVQ